MELNVWQNGVIKKAGEAGLPITDLTLQRGFGLCDVLRTNHREPFEWERHWQRFCLGAKTFDLSLPYQEEEILSAVRSLIESNVEDGEASIKLYLSGGFSPDGYSPTGQETQSFILVAPWKPYPEESYTQGVGAITVNFERSQPEVKSIDYQNALFHFKEKKAAGALELIYHRDDQVTEAATSNLFIVKDGRIATADKKILYGVTRALVLEIAKESYPVEERTIHLSELKTADEIFLTATFKDVLPLTQIDTVPVASGRPGAITLDLLKRYRERYNIGA